MSMSAGCLEPKKVFKKASSHHHALCKVTVPIMRRSVCRRRRKCWTCKWKFRRWRWTAKQKTTFVNVKLHFARCCNHICLVRLAQRLVPLDMDWSASMTMDTSCCSKAHGNVKLSHDELQSILVWNLTVKPASPRQSASTSDMILTPVTA